ncbi:MAG: DUF3793 family protein [Oscillospiraceae bacterium]|nr:DUF3793 family protein [Oscillospiraceae bacterium]
MSEDVLVQCCAPTLAGLKTGSLFSFSYATRAEMASDIRQLNRLLAPRGLRILPLRYTNGHALLYLFRPAGLRRDLGDKTAKEILTAAGYDDLRVEPCVQRLRKRLLEGADFPHEIGLFLSYPPEDVRGFIDNKAKNYKCIGYWKVYGDETRAQQTFEKYKKCTDSYCRSLRAGCCLAQLAVSV